ncbi:MAG TPA: hypothetical protein VGL76_05000 [Gaiellaceae bacterium]
MSSSQKKISGIVAVMAVAGVAIGFYITGYLMSGPAAFHPTVTPGPSRSVNLTLQTDAAVGPSLAPNPDWVSYLVQDQSGKWRRTTVWSLPAHTLVHVTVYQFDGDSGLRNPFMAKVRGTVGNSMQVNGKTRNVIDPDDASHTFAVPALDLIVPLMGVADDAKNQCGYGPCAMSNAHNTITFSFMTPGPGRYRWQCLVPCAAGFLAGFGGPMQTLGYMDGFLNVS